MKMSSKETLDVVLTMIVCSSTLSIILFMFLKFGTGELSNLIP